MRVGAANLVLTNDDFTAIVKAVRSTAIGLSTVGLYAVGVAMTDLPGVGYSIALVPVPATA